MWTGSQYLKIMIAQFETIKHHLTFIQFNVSTEQAFPVENEAFYTQLNKMVDVKVGDIEVVSGYLNAKVESDNKDWEKVMRNHRNDKINENGELYTDLCMNRRFDYRNIHKVTRISSSRKTKNQDRRNIAIKQKMASISPE